MRNALLMDESGGIGAIAALTLPVILGFTALSIEMAQVHHQKIRNQRVADMTALGTALALGDVPIGYEARMIEPTAKGIALANGAPDEEVAALYLPHPGTIPGQGAVKVTVTTVLPLHLGRILTDQANMTVTSTSTAALTMPAASPCFTRPELPPGVVICPPGVPPPVLGISLVE